MILTITMNPSVDIAYSLESFQLDRVNRVNQTHKTPGGKGLNVTRVLAQLGEDVIATGVLGGKIGEFLEEALDGMDIRHSFYKIDGETRNCIAILHEGQQTEILEEGPSVSQEESAGFLNYIEKRMPEIELVSISGSLPKGVDHDYYVHIVKICQKYRIPVVLDSSGQSLLEVLTSDYKPTVIKPNIEELSHILGETITDDVTGLKVALSQKLFAGIDWIIVSLGAKGAFAKHGETFYRVVIPQINVVNPVGSGDSTVAGIASALIEKVSDRDLLKKANTLGMLNAQESLTGYVNLSHYDSLLNQIEVVEV